MLEFSFRYSPGVRDPKAYEKAVRAMSAAIVRRAVEDAQGDTGPENSCDPKRLRKEARHWLFTDDARSLAMGLGISEQNYRIMLRKIR